MVSAILLAAGQSMRMENENKLIKNYKGIPLIKHSIKNILESSIEELIIVLGYQKEKFEKLIDSDKKIRLVFNPNFKSGMASSIKVGLNNISQETKFFFICLGDMPLVHKNIYNKLIQFKDRKEIIVPTYKNKQGNPILFKKTMSEQFMITDNDLGGKKILEANKEKVFNLPFDDPGIILDFDKKESFK